MVSYIAGREEGNESERMYAFSSTIYRVFRAEADMDPDFFERQNREISAEVTGAGAKKYAYLIFYYRNKHEKINNPQLANQVWDKSIS